MENRLGGGRKHCFVNFCSLAMLEFSVDGGGGGGGVGGGKKSQLKSYLFQLVFFTFKSNLI